MNQGAEILPYKLFAVKTRRLQGPGSRFPKSLLVVYLYIQLTNSMIFQRGWLKPPTSYNLQQLIPNCWSKLHLLALIGGHFSSIYDPAGFSTLGECLGFVHSAVSAVRQKRGGNSNISTELIFMNRFTWGVRAVYKEFTIFHLTSNQLDIMSAHPMPLAHFE